MQHIVTKWSGLIGDKRAVTALEYAMIAALIAVACVTVVSGLGTQISGVFNTISGSL